MDDRQLRDEVITTFAAGHETTAVTLSWTFYLLSRHRDVLAAVQREIDDALGGRLPTVDDLRACRTRCRSSRSRMRLYPSAPIVPRLTLKDTELGGHRVPAGSRVLVNLHNIHRHPAHWPDAERFDPGRFGPSRIPRGETAPVRLSALRRGAAPVHRQALRAHGGASAARRAAATLRVPACPVHRVVDHATITLRPRYGMVMTLHDRRPRNP